MNKLSSFKRCNNKNFVFEKAPLILGIIAISWFLLRVIPKPQRATYPCMRLAYPFMSGLIIWILNITGIISLTRISRKKIRSRNYSGAIISLLFLALFVFGNMILSSISLSAKSNSDEIIHTSNIPFGEPKGITPGRVTWVWNPEATNSECTNSLENNDGYYLQKNSNQDVINKMFSDAILNISGEKTIEESWKKIFGYFNMKKERGERSYIPGETIFIKINMGCANWSTEEDLSRREGSLVYSETSPQIILAILDQLVNHLKIPQENIIVADPMSHIYSDVYEILHGVFPDVKYGDRNEMYIRAGRTFLKKETVPVIFYSDKGSVIQYSSECLYSDMQNADYMINIAALKAHACAGITLTAKNHFGSITRKSASHLHKGLVGERNDMPYRLDYKMYRVQVDLMGSSYLGQNTLLFIVDGLWGGPEATMAPVKWMMEPFNNDWPNSVFLSLDQVALESVCFDFLRSECEIGLPEWRNRPNMAQGVDDYLHQAASSNWWPEGVEYDPDNKGVPLQSLGVHEHWDNSHNKNYSGNRGKEGGIELSKILSPN